jgi:serine/threonine protein kinase
MTNWIGKTLGRVHIEALLGRGGMAEVYLGTHTTLQRRVAVKILRSYYTDDPRLRPFERFELEARAVAKLRHPNIVQVFDFDTVEDQPYLVMEFIPGPPLSKYLAALHSRGDRLSLPLISRLLTQMAGALQYAHDRGIIHRDVKPGNILLASRSTPIVPGETLPLDLEPVLTDFGLVRMLDTSRQTVSGLITGTPAYMSPEQAKGEAADGRTDIYSLGIVLYEMLSGKVPFDGESTMSILFKHIHEAPEPIPGLSPVLQRVLDRALAKNVNDRFQQPKEFAAAFDAALENRSHASTLVAIPQVLHVTPPNEVTPARRRTNWWWMPAVLAGALILVAGVSWLLNGRLGSTTVETPTIPPPTTSDTPILSIPVTSSPRTRLHFQDGTAVLSRATLIAQGMPQSPVNSQYKVWLVNGQDRLALGTLHVDENGKAE